MSSPDLLPVITITTENYEQFWPTISAAIIDSSFIAIDCELSGLGDRKKLNFNELDMRYIYTSELVKSNAILSLGLSCFKCRSVSDVNVSAVDGSEKSVKTHDYLVQSFNILVQPEDAYTVQAESLKFLVEHGFDFNLLYSKGILYDRKTYETGSELRNIFNLILKHEKVIIVHNGFIDLMYLYQSLYSPLPKSLDTFAADLNDMFPNGVYDTKYLAEYMQKLPATYLDYLFKKMQLENIVRENDQQWHIKLTLPPFSKDIPHMIWYDHQQIFSYNPQDDDGLELCEKYAFHGWCNDVPCNKSHDINKVVTNLQPKIFSCGKKKFAQCEYRATSLPSIIEREIKKLKNDHEVNTELPIVEEPFELSDTEFDSDNDSLDQDKTNSSTNYSNGDDCNNAKDRNKNGVNGIDNKSTLNSSNSTIKKVKINDPIKGHTAGYDAFMTGYLFAFYIARFGNMKELPTVFSPQNIGMDDDVNKIYLVGKQIPYTIRQGTFAKLSSGHRKNIKEIRN